MRVWGGGLLEDQHFYDECDRLGLMLLQEFPHAGCSPGGPGDSFPDLATRLPLDDAQTKMAVKQLVNHPSIVRYNYANEFYLNSSVSPFIAQVRKETPSSSSFSSQRRADKTKIDDSPRQARDKRKECSPQNSRSRCVFSRSFSQRCAQSTTHAQCTKPTRHVSQSVTDRIHSVWRSMRRTERSVETAQVRATISHRSFACLELPCSLDIGKTEQLITKMGLCPRTNTREKNGKLL
jgi:beta-galactosidase/beta-glucuronidase